MMKCLIIYPLKPLQIIWPRKLGLTMTGIIYPSVQVAGEKINIVLFHKSARVTSIELRDGTRVGS